MTAGTVTVNVPFVLTVTGWIACAVVHYRQKLRDVRALDRFINQLESDSHD